MRLLLILTLALLAGCDIIRDQFDGNQPPIIDTLDATPAEGVAPVLARFNWTVLDADSHSLSCTIDFGDGQNKELPNCGQVANHFHTYIEPGGYVAVLTAEDGVGSTSKSITVRVLEGEESALRWREPGTLSSSSRSVFVRQARP